jgi:anti-sigma regulatory factor (Ser/Thr protein kinase)
VIRPTHAGLYAELAGIPSAARQARELVREAVGEGHPFAGDAELITSELVTNAVTHTRSGKPGGSLVLAVRAHPDQVQILVRDSGGPSAPTRTSAADLGGEHGRGLAIVNALATEWGSHASPSGRATWCRLSRDRTPGRTAGREPEREAN